MVERKDQLTIYIPQSKRDKNIVERLNEIAEEEDRSVNYLTIQAIIEYLEKEEKDQRSGNR